jgi:hypothetical protein
MFLKSPSVQHIDSSTGLSGAREVDNMMYAPCTVYALTGMGMEFAGKGTVNADNVFLPDDTPIRDLVYSLDKYVAYITACPPAVKKTDSQPDGYIDVICLKITPREQKSHWQNAFVPANIRLDRLHMFICEIYNHSSVNNYSFFPGGQENPFYEITNRLQKKAGKSPGERESRLKSRLYEFLKGPGDTILYMIEGNGVKTNFDIRVIKTDRKRANNLPRVTRQGKGFNGT